MAHNYIIQWNCRGLRSNREDIELLISKYSPAAICLQEILLTPHQTQAFKHYSAYYKSGIHGHGGVCILVINKFIRSQVQFQADLQAVAVCITINNKTYMLAEDKMATFSNTLLDIAADNIPKTSPFPKRKAKPWFDEDYQAAKKERNKANILANKHPSAANSMRSRLIQARTKKLFKQKKRDSWKNYVSSVNVNAPSKKVWNMIRKITGKNVASPMHHIKDENGTLIIDRVQIANTLDAAIEKSSSSKNYSKEFQSIKAQKEKQNINFKTNRNLRYNKKFTMRDLKRSFKKSNNSSPGPDQIHYEILRHLPIETLHILLDIINETWKSDTFPESWREALIISIPKPGKDHFNPLNYRPIALTSCICKTVERMVNERLVWYLEKNGLLAKQQCGYRANRSTVDHLICLETFILDALIQNQHLVAVFFDLQKAYDTTWKHGIQQDLHDMGLRGNLPIFIGNFLSDRTFQIHLGTILSDLFHQEEGVPQGTILSTTLFNVKINDIVTPQSVVTLS